MKKLLDGLYSLAIWIVVIWVLGWAWAVGNVYGLWFLRDHHPGIAKKICPEVKN
jgi:hypothetical protein